MSPSDVGISVIVLTFNSQKYIARCLAALAEQTFKAFEVVIVDAGSTDSTLPFIERFKDRLSIRICAAPGTNMGQARNVGIRAAVGKYLCYCDSDDYYLPEKLAAQFHFLNEHPEFSVCYYDAIHFESSSPQQTYLARRSAGKCGDLSALLVRAQTININTIMVRRLSGSCDTFFPDDEAGKYGEDWQYLVNLAVAGARFGFLRGSYSMVEVRSDSHTSWDIQHLMKWYVLKHLLENKAAFLRAGVSQFDLVWAYVLHYAKFVGACCVSGHSQFVCDRPVTRGSLLERWFIRFYKGCCIALLERPYFRQMLKHAWLFHRQRKSRPVATHSTP